MTVFRCKRSGNTVSFTSEDDVKAMRQHEGYEEVVDGLEATPSFLQPTEQKRKGRQPKVAD